MAIEALRLKRQPKEESREDNFRKSLQDVIDYSIKLAPICKSIDEMVQLCELAMTNSAQAQILMGLIDAPEETK